MEKKERKYSPLWVYNYHSGTFSLCNNTHSLYWKILYLHVESISKEKIANNELRKKPSKTLTSSPGFHARFLIEMSTSCLRGRDRVCSTDPAWSGICTLVNSRQIPNLKIWTPSSENCCIGHGNAQATFSARALH